MRRHLRMIENFYTPTKEVYIGLGQLSVCGKSGVPKNFDLFDPRLPEFVAAAMKVFAERELR